MTNQEWISKGNTGCTFATLFSKSPAKVGWGFFSPETYGRARSNDKLPLIVSIEFHGRNFWNKRTVRHWALKNGFYEEETSDETVGLRIKCKEGVSWVQYFGPDSHVITRQSPTPMLMYTNKLGRSYYIKVGFKGILHLAHAWYSKITEDIYDLLWERSYKQTEKRIGHAPTIIEAAKTTWKKEDI